MTLALVILGYLLQLTIIARALLREGLAPTVRLGWVMVISALPGVGIIAYVMFGEVRLHRANVQRMTEVRARLIAASEAGRSRAVTISGADAAVFASGAVPSDFAPVVGNRAVLLPEGDEMMDDPIDAIDAARAHVHVLFYIWLPDATGTRMAEALIRASGRGVACRVLVDDHGARHLIRSELWTRMGAAGVQLVKAAPVGNPLISFLYQRLDLRNHRKIIVIDNRLTWCGSRNCADAAFRIKARYAPWVDILIRMEGPVVRQQQAVFLQDWMTHHAEDLSHLLSEPVPDGDGGIVAQVIASGPDDMDTGPSDVICAMIFGAREQVMLTTPYYVPNNALHGAICAAARRGVRVTLILPARNDSWVIGAASESLYLEMLRAGVRIMAFRPGLIHAKIVTVDGRLSLIGSSNLDHRSFDLNYENCILMSDPDITAELDARQGSYIDRAAPVLLDDVRQWSIPRRLRNNTVALASPLL
ncbi:cardiolipin synthase [Rhodobacteraceae bacterium 2376]|uniref:Cardiolipin synthase n=1 Tax=Rhabdonatronobacter sediminivivens TaxID=2743469 RepID=A0A7Z0HZR9_9RHOB|nr:cardiolipin synthase [Rhabdonatronobacter sediminivivens]NYS25314.1 cardiolipin synthase [Rhabdonatronobacter sediminivivens]